MNTHSMWHVVIPSLNRSVDHSDAVSWRIPLEAWQGPHLGPALCHEPATLAFYRADGNENGIRLATALTKRATPQKVECRHRTWSWRRSPSEAARATKLPSVIRRVASNASMTAMSASASARWSMISTWRITPRALGEATGRPPRIRVRRSPYGTEQKAQRAFLRRAGPWQRRSRPRSFGAERRRLCRPDLRASRPRRDAVPRGLARTGPGNRAALPLRLEAARRLLILARQALRLSARS